MVLTWGPVDVYTGAGDLYVVRADTTAARAIRKWPRRGPQDGLPYGADAAIWSPNRDSIAVELSVWADSDPRSRVAVVDPMEGDLRIITPGDDVYLYGWSVDGLHVNARDAGGGRFLSLPAAGGRSKPLRIAGARHLGLVDWSPDGTRIAAMVRGGGIVAMNSDGTDVTRVTSDGRRPVWSPDGGWILFTRGTYDEETLEWTNDVYRIRADGQDERRLTVGGSSEGLDWSSDGKLVLFRRCCEASEVKPHADARTLWVMDAEGKRQTRLPFNKAGWDVVSADWGN